MPDTPVDPVDAVALASRGAEVVRTFTLDALVRLEAAGAGSGTVVTARFRFNPAAGGIGVAAFLEGKVVLTCQRCLKPLEQPIASESALVLVRSEAEAERVAEGREPVVVDANRLDLGWLAEEEMLLALPLVPMHDAHCVAAEDVRTEPAADTGPQGERQRPFENLRDLLNRH